MTANLIDLIILVPVAILTVTFWYMEFQFFKDHWTSLIVPKQTKNIFVDIAKNTKYTMEMLTGIFLLAPLFLDLFLTLAISKAFGGGSSLMGLAIGLLISDILSGFLAITLNKLPREL